MTFEKPRKFDGQKMVLIVFESAMAVLYFAIGIILLIAPLFHTVFQRAAINDGLRILLGAILGLYGLFRIYRSIKIISRRDR
jgi:hypothetical protein